MPSIADVARSLNRAARSLRRSPVYAGTAILTLALGIGANVLIFSVASAVLLRPLPYKDAASLYWLDNTHSRPDGGLGQFPIGPRELTHWRAGTRTLSQIEALTTAQLALTGDGEPETVTGWAVTGGLFEMLGIRPARGRWFTAAEDVPGSGVVIVSDEFWRRRLAANPAAIGQTLVLNGEPRAIIGIMPPGYRPVLQKADLWIPLGLDPASLERRGGNRYMFAVGRARPGVTRLQIDSDLGALSAQLAAQFPITHTGWSGKATLLREELARSERGSIIALLALVGFLLLLACANVANLTLARTASRRAESALRLALGAGAWQVVQAPLAESLVIALVGGGSGLLIAALAVGPLAALDPVSLPTLHTVRIDGRVVGFALGVTLLTGLLCALIPALYVLRASPAGILAEGGRRSAGGLRDHRTRRLLMTAQIALALVLVAGATSMVRVLMSLGRTSPGFDPAGVTVAVLTLPETRYDTKEKRAAFVNELLRRARAVPGITAASMTSNQFLVDNSRQTTLAIEGHIEAPGEQITAHFRRIAPDYFTTMRIPVRRGRAIDESDRTDGVPVVLVNRAFAERYWPNEDPIGKRVRRTAANATWLPVVGVVEDVRDSGLSDPLGPMIYVPYAQNNQPFVTLVARSVLPQAQVNRALREVVKGTDALQPIDVLEPLERLLADSLTAQRFRALLLTLFAGLGLVLASVGIYGVTAYLLAERTREVGVRMALGARSADVLRLLVLESARWVGLGILVGLSLTVALTTVAKAVVANLISVDLASSGGVALLISAVAMGATVVPTLRATRTSPSVALRGD